MPEDAVIPTIIGVDPGKAGAIAVLDAGVRVYPMPLVRSSKGRNEYDLHALGAIFRTPMFERQPAVAVYVELGQALPRKMGGAAANFHRGYGRGLFEGILTALLIPYTLVTPQQWQRVQLRGTSGRDTKQRSIIAAQRLFPWVSLLPSSRCRKPSDGMADALLIAAYGRRIFVGKEAECRP